MAAVGRRGRSREQAAGLASGRQLGEASGRDPRGRYLYPADITRPSCCRAAEGRCCWGGTAASPRPPPLICSCSWAADPRVDNNNAHRTVGTPRPQRCISLPTISHHTSLSLGLRGSSESHRGTVPPTGGHTDRETAWADAGRESRGLSPSHPDLTFLEPDPLPGSCGPQIGFEHHKMPRMVP